MLRHKRSAVRDHLCSRVVIPHSQEGRAAHAHRRHQECGAWPALTSLPGLARLYSYALGAAVGIDQSKRRQGYDHDGRDHTPRTNGVDDEELDVGQIS